MQLGTLPRTECPRVSHHILPMCGRLMPVQFQSQTVPSLLKGVIICQCALCSQFTIHTSACSFTLPIFF
uniref:Uncharacterized protein n=1 Tax=Anguilla anguilla TaxID=7936 RepID=A0A0E9RL70_ANGAN